MPQHESEQGRKFLLYKHYRAVNWVSVLLFLGLSSLIFAWIFEWDRHYFNCDPQSHIMSTSDKALLFWFLVAKSMTWFLPFILIYGSLLALTSWRVANFSLHILWLFTFFIMATDLFAYSIQGMHSWDYFELFTASIVETPQLVFSRIWHFVGIKLIGGAVFILAVFIISGPVFFFTLRWFVAKAVYRFEWLISRRSLASLTAGFILFSLGIIPLSEQFRDRVIDILPITESHKRLLGCFSESIQVLFGLAKQNLVPSEDLDHSMVVNWEDERFVTNIVNDALSPNPEGTHSSVIPNRPDLPNVVLIVVESFRANALDPGRMKELGEWAKQGLRLQRHYSGSNTSRPGLFSLLSGQIALHQIRDSEIGFQMIELLKSAGYRTTFLGYRDTFNFMGIEDWYSSIPFDNFIQEGDYSIREEDRKDWPDSDSRKMKRALQILNTSTDRPNFLLLFLLSSHTPYAFPPEFEIFKSPRISKLFNPKYKVSEFLNRYSNSLSFLDKEITQFLRQLDLSRNIVIITGDHGESMKEDGVFFHGSRPSEVQLRVPFIMVGPGIKPREIHTATSHNDVLPSLLHLITGKNFSIPNSHGRDLFGDPMPVDEIVVAPYRGYDLQEILLIRGNKRLVFKSSADPDKSTKLEFIGVVDETGQYKLRANKDRKTVGACW